ncbi:MAG TPA: hypothetical protein VFV54_06975, partial [Thermoanaerobaculia bacterium]|nr:hypothetical protein [Thermoanaerobaculia bacterium]
EGKKLGVVGEPEPFQGSMRLTADGTRAYISVDDREGVARRWVYGLTRSSRTPLSTHWAWESSQVLTPDGSTVYYASDRAELPDIYRQRLDGSGNEEVVISGPGDQFPNDVSPDGKYLLYTSAGGPTGADLMALPLTGSEKPFVVARSPAYDGNGRFSPDGTWVAYLSNVSARQLVYAKRFREEGLPQEVSSTPGQNPRWSPDGRYLYYATDESHTVMRAARLPDGSFDEPRPLFTLPERIRSFELHPDGRRILALLAEDEQITRPINIITGWEPPKK